MSFAAAAPYIAMGVSGLLGMLQNRNKQTQTQTTTPTMDPAYGPLQTMLLNTAMSRLQSGAALPTNYEAGGVNAINRSYDLAGQGLQNSLTSRGLGTSPVGGVGMERMASERAGEISRFRANVPMVEREQQNQNFGLMTHLLNMGRGSTSSGTSTQTGGGGLAGGAENMARMMNYLIQSGAFGSSTPAFGIGAQNTGSWSMRP